MVKVQTILQNDAVIAQPFWRAVFTAADKRVKGFNMHPTQYHQFNQVWLA
jgi:peptide/nickel transport system substrate-binding protein